MSFLNTIFDNLRDQPQRAKLIEVHATTLRGTDGSGLLDLVAKARGYLGSAGVNPGDRVALLAANSVRWVAADLAALAAGGIVVPLYDREGPEDLAGKLRSAQPVVLIVGKAELGEAVRAAWPEGKDCKIVVLDDVFEHAASQAGPHAFAPDDTVTIIYTSGTSGEPKGVELSRANIDFMIPRTIERIERAATKKSEPDRVFHYLPFCFAASRLMLWTQLSRPNPLMISTDLNKLVVEMASAKPNYFLNVPAVLERIRTGVGTKIEETGGIALELYQRGFRAHKAVTAGNATFIERATLALAQRVVFPKIKQRIGVNLEFLISGSGPLAEETQRWFQMIGIPVYQAYGLTETTGIVSLDEPDRVEPGRVGVALPGVKTKITEDGELLISGANVFKGYWNKPEETARCVVDGWFHTGDQVDITNQNLKIIGRVKNLLIPESGHNVAPEPMEEKFREYCPEAEQAVVIGHARPFLALIVTGQPSEASVEAALEQMNPAMPFYKRLRKVIYAQQVFSPENGLLTPNQKLRRNVIEKHFAADIDALYDAHRVEKEQKARQQEASR